MQRKVTRFSFLSLVFVCGIVVFATLIVTILIMSHKFNVLDKKRKHPNQNGIPESLIWEKEVKFTFGEIIEATQDFDDKYCIGQGGFGTVYKAVLRSGTVLAVKHLHLSDSSDTLELSRMSF